MFARLSIPGTLVVAVAIGIAAALQPESASLLVVVGALALVALVAATNVLRPELVLARTGGTGTGASHLAATRVAAPSRGVTRLVLLSKPRR